MFKLGIIGVWCVSVCLVAFYISVTREPGTAVEPQFPVMTEHHVVKSDLVTVPVIRDKKVDGYVLAEVSLTANDEAFHHRDYTATELTDQLITVLQSGSPSLTDPDFTVDLIRAEIVKQMNERMGAQVFYNTLLTRLDYLTPADLERMRDPAGRQMKVTNVLDKSQLDQIPDLDNTAERK